MDITFNRVMIADRPRILEIAGQVWDGEDYVPDVLDEWLADPDAKLIAAQAGGQVVAFGRYLRMLPDYAWLEGLRTDPAWGGRGIGKALFGQLLEAARRDGATRAGMSTYIDNTPSQRIAGGHDFARVAGFVYCEADRAAAQASPAVQVISSAEALAFIRTSAFLAASHGFFPHGWRFYPFARGPEAALARMAHVLGIRRAGHLVALLCAGTPTHGPRTASIDFLDGDPPAMATLLRHALALVREPSHVEAMIPKWGADVAPALEVVREFGFQVWNEFTEDVFVYEREL